MENKKQRKTFLSYSRVNTDFAKKLAKELKAEGFDVWFDQLDIPAGSRWDREVEKALRDCDIFMVIMTSASIDSENVLDEIGYAIDAGKRLLPVLLEPCEVPFRLRRFQYVDFTNKGFDDGLESAKDLLRGLIAQNTIPRGEVPAVSQDKLTKTDTDGKTKEDADRLAAQKAEVDRLAKQKAEDERLVKAKVATEPMAKDDVDRLASQKAEADKLAKQKAEDERIAKAKAEAERKAKEKAKSVEAIPVGINEESVSQTIPTQKNPLSKGLVIGIIAVVVLAITGIGFFSFIKGQALKVVLDPAEAESLYDSTTSVWSLAGDTYGDNLGSMFIRNGSATTATFNLNNPTLIPLKLEMPGACGNTQAEAEANLLLVEVTLELNGQRVPDRKISIKKTTGYDSTSAEFPCQDHFVILSNWEKGSKYTLKYTANIKKEFKWGDQVIQVGTLIGEFIISTP